MPARLIEVGRQEDAAPSGLGVSEPDSAQGMGAAPFAVRTRERGGLVACDARLRRAGLIGRRSRTLRLNRKRCPDTLLWQRDRSQPNSSSQSPCGCSALTCASENFVTRPTPKWQSLLAAPLGRQRRRATRTARKAAPAPRTAPTGLYHATGAPCGGTWPAPRSQSRHKLEQLRKDCAMVRHELYIPCPCGFRKIAEPGSQKLESLWDRSGFK